MPQRREETREDGEQDQPEEEQREDSPVRGALAQEGVRYGRASVRHDPRVHGGAGSTVLVRRFRHHEVTRTRANTVQIRSTMAARKGLVGWGQC